MLKRKPAPASLKDAPAGGPKSLAIALAVQKAARKKATSNPTYKLPSKELTAPSPEFQEEHIDMSEDSESLDLLADVPEEQIDANEEDIVSRIRQRLNNRRGF